jgi:hypothetical protein
MKFHHLAAIPVLIITAGIVSPRVAQAQGEDLKTAGAETTMLLKPDTVYDQLKPVLGGIADVLAFVEKAEKEKQFTKVLAQVPSGAPLTLFVIGPEKSSTLPSIAYAGIPAGAFQVPYSGGPVNMPPAGIKISLIGANPHSPSP